MEVYGSRPLLPIVDVRLSDDSQVNRDLSLAALSATEEFITLFSVPPPAGIRPVSILYPSDGLPRIVSTPDTTRYKVYLTVKNRYYHQLVFQLGHELCHIFADPRRSNWFVESCCEMASLVLLRRMSKLWGNDPPRADWRSYAPKFQQYAQNRIRKAREAEDPDDRLKNVIVAEMLCPLFEESTETWDALCFLGQASVCPPVSLIYLDLDSDLGFDRWLQAVPRNLEGIVVRIGKMLKDRWHEFDFYHTVMPL
jgi:hypothetical protein